MMIIYEFFIIDYILVLKLFGNKNGSMTKLYNALLMLRIVFMNAHCICLCMLETYIYNSVSHTIDFLYSLIKLIGKFHILNDR